MKIRNQLFIIFAALCISASLIASLLIYFKDKNIYPPRNFLIVFNILFIPLSLGFSYITARYLANPMEELIESANKIREGDLSSRVNRLFNNELGVLADTFNKMAEKLENKMNESDKLEYVISHDLRAPLNTIIPLVNYIREDNKETLNQESMKMLTMIESNARQMNELILEILNSARREKKIKENIHVYSLTNSILNDINPPPPIQVFIQHNLPVIEYHKISLIKIYQKLIENSIKNMENKPGKIRIGYSYEGDMHTFWVSDSGPGIPKKDFEKISELFKLSTTKTENDSTGSGFGTIKNIVEENGGKIWLESEPGQGSTFYFTVPNS